MCLTQKSGRRQRQSCSKYRQWAAKQLPAAELISNVEQASGGKVLTVKIPADADRSWQFGVEGEKRAQKARQDEKKPSRPTIFYVNPYTGAVLGNSAAIKSGTVTFMTYMFSLHRWLLLDKIEQPIFG